MQKFSRIGLLASFVCASAFCAQAQACPVAHASETGWVTHQSSEFDIEIRSPTSFRKMNWSSRSDSSTALFSVWKDAATTLDFAGAGHRIAANVNAAKGKSCALKTAAGDFTLTVLRWTGGQSNGRDTTYFDAVGQFRIPGHSAMFIKLTAHDSLTLLESIQILQTLRPASLHR